MGFRLSSDPWLHSRYPPPTPLLRFIPSNLNEKSSTFSSGVDCTRTSASLSAASNKRERQKSTHSARKILRMPTFKLVKRGSGRFRGYQLASQSSQTPQAKMGAFVALIDCAALDALSKVNVFLFFFAPAPFPATNGAVMMCGALRAAARRVATNGPAVCLRTVVRK